MKTHRRNLNLSQTGMSLVEVLVALGMVSILTLVISQVVMDGVKGQKKTDMKGAIAAVNNQIVNTLGNSDLCLRAFDIQGTSAPNRVGTPTAYPTVRTLNGLNVNQGGNVSNIITTGTDLMPGLRTSSIQLSLDTDIGLTPNPAVGPNRRIAGQVIVQFQSTNPNIPMTLRPLSYPVLLTVDTTNDGTIVSCSPASNLTEQTICENLFNGAYDGSKPNERCRMRGYSFSSTKTLQDLGLVNSRTVAFDAPSATGRGLVVYGAGARFSLFPTETDFVNNTANVSSLSRSANDLVLSTAGSVRTSGNLVSGGTVESTTDMTAARHLTVGGNVSTAGNLSVGGNLVFSGDLTSANRNGAGFNLFSANQMNANTFVTPSDRRLKENIKAMPNQLESVLKIQTYFYNYKSDVKKIKRFGVIAQEIEKIYPEIVIKNPQQDLRSVNYQELIPVLIKSVQELNQKIESLEAQVKKLEAQASAKVPASVTKPSP